jgi:hypothetical protein
MRTHPDVVFTPLEDSEGVLLHLETKRYYTLNETGCRIWELATRGQTPVEIARALAREYEIGADAARRHAEALLDELQAEQLLLA